MWVVRFFDIDLLIGRGVFCLCRLKADEKYRDFPFATLIEGLVANFIFSLLVRSPKPI